MGSESAHGSYRDGVRLLTARERGFRGRARLVSPAGVPGAVSLNFDGGPHAVHEVIGDVAEDSVEARLEVERQ